MRSLGALLVTVVMCGVCVSSAAAQIMTGQPNRPRDRSGNWNAPTMPLDTDVATRRPTFRASVTRVEVSALVVDAAGRPVRDLRPDEVQIYDGGKRQKVRTFTAVSRASNPVPLDTLSPTEAAAAARETNAWAGTSRLIALVIDDLHIDPRHAERARVAARRLVDELVPSDLLFVGLTSSPAESTAAFTRDRRRALDIIGRFGGLRLPDESQEMRQGHSLGASSPGLAASEQQRSMRLVDAYETIQRVGVAARSVPGRRKTLVFLSEGSPGATSAAASTALTAEVTGAMMNAVAAATVGDVAVYPIDPSGLGTPTDRLVEGFTRAVDDTGREIAHVDLSNLIAGFLQARNQLRDLAALTGGVSLVDRNDLDGAIARVLGDASDYYVISYEPDKAVKGTKVRPIEVRVSRPGVRVHARRGYLAPPATPPDVKADHGGLSPDMTALLGGVVPEDGVPMLVRVLPIAHAGERVRHAVVVDAAGGVLMGGLHRGQVSFEQAVADVDAAGRIGMVTHRTATFKAKTSQAGQLGQEWVRTIWAIDLSPGEHQVRIATSLTATGVRGSMYVDVRVAPGQALDTAALASVVSDAKPTVFIDPVLQDVMAPAALARTRELDADVRGARVERDVTMTHAPPEWLAIPKDGRLAASDGLDFRPLQNAGVSFENASLGMLVGALRNVGSCADDVRVRLQYTDEHWQPVGDPIENEARVTVVEPDGLLPYRFRLGRRADFARPPAGYVLQVVRGGRHVGGDVRSGEPPATVDRRSCSPRAFAFHVSKGPATDSPTSYRVTGMLRVRAGGPLRADGITLTALLLDKDGQVLEVLTGTPDIAGLNLPGGLLPDSHAAPFTLVTPVPLGKWVAEVQVFAEALPDAELAARDQ